MSLHLVTAPSVKPVTLEELKEHLRIDVADEDDLLGAYLDAALAHLDGRDGWLNRALCTQSWDLKLDGFPPATRHNRHAAIYVPLPPLQSVTSVTYTDPEGNSQTLDPSSYVVSDGGFAQARVAPSYGETWPTTRDELDVVTLRFVAGYLDESSPPDTQAGVRAAIKAGIKLLVAHWYVERQPVNIGNSVNEIPMSVEALLRPYVVQTFW